MTTPQRTSSAPTDIRGRRTQIVWGALLGSMTLVGGILLMLEGTPAPNMNGIALAAPVAAGSASPMEAIYRTRAPIDETQWDGIVIHHTGSPYGSPEQISARHIERGLHGLGYHFLVGNGNGAGNGELHVGYRWLDQLPGAHATGPQEAELNRRYLGVCLIGDGNRQPFSGAQIRRLAQLTASLQSRLGITSDRVVLHRDVTETTSPGRLFPEAEFRDALRRLSPPE